MNFQNLTVSEFEFSIFFFLVDDRECVQLSRCEEVQWISTHMNSQLDINQLSCGFENGEPKVWCHVNTIEESSAFGGTMDMLRNYHR